jgi:drug/metabolite transporter (DMT)-like permease
MKIPNLSRIVVLFAALAIAGVCLIVLPQQATVAAVRSTLPLVGSALLASGLTFFLVEATRLTQK